MEIMSGLPEFLEELYELFYYGLGIAELGISGVVLIYTIVVALVAMVCTAITSLALFILGAIPLYRIGKKLQRPSVWLIWLSWLPVIGGYFRSYVLADIPGDKPLWLTEKYAIENRKLSFWIMIGIGVFGGAIISALIGILSLIPVLGQIGAMLSMPLYLAPIVAVEWMQYAYLRDVLDLFSGDRKKNRTAAIVVAALDAVATMGFAQIVYLYTIMNKEPLAAEETPV